MCPVSLSPWFGYCLFVLYAMRACKPVSLSPWRSLLNMRNAKYMHVNSIDSSKAMGGRGKEKGAGSSGKGKKATWIEATANRLEEHGNRVVGKGKGAVPTEVREAVAERARTIAGDSRPRGVFARPPEDAASDEEASEPVALASAAAVYSAALDEHRRGGGVRASGFEPQRNTFFVLGRPVQVLMWQKTCPMLFRFSMLKYMCFWVLQTPTASFVTSVADLCLLRMLIVGFLLGLSVYPECMHFPQVLVLTHERASTEEVIPYLQWVFYPLPVVCLFGRCAAESPTINKESCVYYGWKDRLLPRSAEHHASHCCMSLPVTLQLSLSPLLRDGKPCIHVHGCTRVMQHTCVVIAHANEQGTHDVVLTMCMPQQSLSLLLSRARSFEYSWLQDHIIPYMADERHAPDTLFFVVEEDFRLFARHSGVAPDTLGRLGEAAYAASSTAVAARAPNLAEMVNEPVALTLSGLYEWRYEKKPIGVLSADLFGPPSVGTDSWRKLIGGLYAPTHKPSSAEVENNGVSEYVEDLVKIVTAAARQGKGDLVWLSYEARNSKGLKCRVCHASTLVAVSAAGAKKLADVVGSTEFSDRVFHFDVLLLRYLEKHGNEFGASYVYPCIGHYQAHLSQSSDHEGWRDSRWLNTWVQEGTRPAHTAGGRTRWLMGWTQKGLVWIRDIPLPERREDLRWFTRTSAPAGWREETEARRREPMLKGKGKGKPPPVLIQPLYMANATVMPDDPTANTVRRKRARRAQQRDYAFRIFVSAGDAVACSVFFSKAMSVSPGSVKKKPNSINTYSSLLVYCVALSLSPGMQIKKALSLSPGVYIGLHYYAV